MNPKILVVGDVMLDRYIHGTVERISPEAPIPILRQTHIEDRPGGAANVACNLASLGADVTLVGNVAPDEPGAALGMAIGRGIRLEWAMPAPPDARTTVKTRSVAMGQQMLRVDIDGTPMTDRQRVDMRERILMTLETQQVAAVVLSDYAGGVLDVDTPSMIKHARRMDIPVYVDPKGTDWGRYRGATLIKPNEAELRAMVDWDPNDASDMRAGIDMLLHEYDIDSMLVTQGAGGMTLVHKSDPNATSADCPWYHQMAKSGPVVDVTGAGDTVLACVAYLQSRAVIWPDALRLAAIGAAAVCARHGTSIVTRMDLGFGEAKFRHFIESAPLVNQEFIA